LGGKETLIKAIAQSIPVFAMMVFKIPKNICKGISDVIAQFWWGDEEEQKHMHWKAWWKMCIPKKSGGMGFRDLHCFNLAMLSKQVWRLLSEPESLCARVLRAKYYPDGKLLNATLKGGSSYTWQSIMAGLSCFKKGYIWRVGDGTQINIWEDNWIPSSHNLKVMTPKGNNLFTHVSDLINPVDGNWDEELLETMFWPVDVHIIKQIPLIQDREDLVAWHFNKLGLFSVRSAYYCQWDFKFGRSNRNTSISEAASNTVWDKLWGLEIPSKIKIFGWRVLHGMIPCRGILANRHIGNQGGCPLCNEGCEDMKHMLFTCQRAKEVWRCLGLWGALEEILIQDRSGSVIVEEIIRKGGRLQLMDNVGFAELVLCAGWYIWWERRQKVHNEEIQTPFRSATSIVVITKNYMMAAKKPRSPWRVC
jgi:hypothetical protein